MTPFRLCGVAFATNLARLYLSISVARGHYHFLSHFPIRSSVSSVSFSALSAQPTPLAHCYGPCAGFLRRCLTRSLGSQPAVASAWTQAGRSSPLVRPVGLGAFVVLKSCTCHWPWVAGRRAVPRSRDPDVRSSGQRPADEV